MLTRWQDYQIPFYWNKEWIFHAHILLSGRLTIFNWNCWSDIAFCFEDSWGNHWNILNKGTHNNGLNLNKLRCQTDRTKTNELAFHTFFWLILQFFYSCSFFAFEGKVADWFYLIIGEIPAMDTKK